MALTVIVIMFPMIYAFILAIQVPSQYYEFPPRLPPGSSLMDNVRHAWEQINLGHPG